MRARVPAIENGAGTPKGPASGGGCAGDTLGCDFDKVELIGWVVVDCAAEEREEDEEDGAGDEHKRDESENRPC